MIKGDKMVNPNKVINKILGKNISVDKKSKNVSVVELAHRLAKGDGFDFDELSKSKKTDYLELAEDKKLGTGRVLEW